MKRILNTILIFALLLPQITAVNAAAPYDWSYNTAEPWNGKVSNIYMTYDGRSMPFRPADKYVSDQNPPSFTWPHANNATSYELQICSDAAMTNPKFTKTGIKDNYYNFDRVFEKGTDYYWRVRYYVGTSVSTWSDVRRFRIDPDAHEFMVPGIDALMNNVPSGHPRIWTTSDNLEEFRAHKDKNETGRATYEWALNDARNYVSAGTIPEEPTEFGAAALNASNKITTMIYKTAFAYLINGDEELGDFAIQLMYALSKWSWDNKTGPTSYIGHDQAHRSIAYNSAIAYDWVYDLLSQSKYDTERQSIVNMIKERTKIMADDVIEPIKLDPYASHGWTAIGYTGIVGVAMKDEFPEAEQWLREIIPLYTAVLPPWSYEDGGWSQGQDYWQYSAQMGIEFIDVLKLAGIINLYDSAWLRNQYLWSLYAYPAGSYGSFGDQSGKKKAEDQNYTSHIMSKYAAFTGNPLTRWIADQTGGMPSNVLSSYYASMNYDMDAQAPADYPLSHQFKDIGWAVMTSDLEDPNRIHATFKSSPYGSFNHSEADQNSFFIQAYGEKLAVKSGYYDTYHGAHNNSIARKTFAHNSITLNDGDGQSYYGTRSGLKATNDRFDAKGELTQFVTQMSFDSVTGDATQAYMDSPAGNTKKIGKFVRNMIYVRPNTFIVVDDLAAYAKTPDPTGVLYKDSFKWWLNSEHPMEYHNEEDNTYAIISEGDARLKANVLYPRNTTAAYYSGFVDLEGNYWPANEGAGHYIGANEQDRISFATSKCANTKMVVTMSVYKDGEQPNEPENLAYSSKSGKEYVKLSYADGTVVIVNLNNDLKEMTVDGITFKGQAVTYNNDSIMLTNGTYLKKDGKDLIKSTKDATIALGCNQLCFSSNDDCTISVDKSNNYLTFSGSRSLGDINGRMVSPEIGLTTADTASGIDIAAQKGSYSLKTSEDAPISVRDIVPRDLSVYPDSNSDGSLKAAWSMNSKCSYDVKVNGIEYSNVSSPFSIPAGNSADSYTVCVRARLNNIVSDWSNNVNYDFAEKPVYSHVKFKEDGNTVKSKIYVSKLSERAMLLTGLFDNDNMLIKVNAADARQGINIVDIDSGDAKVKTYLWNEKTLTPLTADAVYGEQDTDLAGIYADGKLIDGFDNSTDEYTIVLEENAAKIPKITAQAFDNSSKVVIHSSTEQMRADIKITAPDGTERTVVISFELPDGINRHKVYNASAFMADSGMNADINGQSGKQSQTNVGVFTYTTGGKKTTVNLPLFTSTRANQGEKRFGSRICSDRSPNGGNHMEIHELSEGLQGWDYFVLPNGGYYSEVVDKNKGDLFTDEFLSFTLTEDAEVVVLGTNTVDSLVTSDGFSAYSGEYGTARYMNGIGAEDMYYNIAFNGGSESDVDIDAGGTIRFSSYDAADRWVNVAPLTKTDETGKTRNMTKEEYFEEKPAKERFTVSDTGMTWVQNWNIVSKYSRIYRIEEDGADVKLDLSELKGRVIVMIRPITPQPFISNLRYMGPVSFAELDGSMTEGCTDTSAKRNVYFVSFGMMKPSFESGSRALIENYTLNVLDDMLGLEGVSYIPPSYYMFADNAECAWQRAYYFGKGSEGGFDYPGFEGKTHPWYSFDLSSSANLYVVTAGGIPEFIDDSWEKVTLNRPLFATTGIVKSYGTIYKKYIGVADGETEHITMYTPGTGRSNSAYYLFIQEEK